MIQRIQSIYLLLSAGICLAVFFIPLGTVDANAAIHFYAYGFIDSAQDLLMQSNVLLGGLLGAIVCFQLLVLLMFKNRPRQSMMAQISLVLQLGFVVLALMHQDVFPLVLENATEELTLNYSYGILVMAISWVLTYLALRGIKKDEALVRSADRMR